MMIEAFPGGISQYSIDNSVGRSSQWGEPAFPGSVLFDESDMTEEDLTGTTEDPNLTEEEN